MECNGKMYPLWGQFVERKEEFIGGILEDTDDGYTARTFIEDISLTPNGEDSAFFEIHGEDWGSGFDVGFGGIIAGEEGWITFSGYGNHTFRIRRPDHGSP